MTVAARYRVEMLGRSGAPYGAPRTWPDRASADAHAIGVADALAVMYGDPGAPWDTLPPVDARPDGTVTLWGSVPVVRVVPVEGEGVGA